MRRIRPLYAAYVQPNAGSSSIIGGWQSRSFEAPVQFLLQVAFT